MILSVLKSAILMTVGMLAIAMLFAYGVHLVTGLSLEALILAFSPGGVAEMNVITVTLNIDPVLRGHPSSGAAGAADGGGAGVPQAVHQMGHGLDHAAAGGRGLRGFSELSGGPNRPPRRSSRSHRGEAATPVRG